jgi:O-antigen/teichoic acid export membrane protein
LEKLKELFSDTIIYGISNVLARFINYLLVPLYTKVFETAQYGVISLIYAAIAFLNVIFTFGMESAYLRYAKDRAQARRVFKTIQISLLGLATFLVFLLWVLSPVIMPLLSLSPETKNIYLMMIGILWFDTLSIVPFAELRLVRKAWQYATVRTVNVLINLGLNFYLILVLGWGIRAVFVANLAASGLTTLFMWALTARLLKGSWSRAIFRKAFWFGMPFVPAGIGYAINEILDRFFLNNYMSQQTTAHLYGPGVHPADIVGIYSACYKLAVFMLLLIQMFRMAWQPFFLRYSDDEEAPQLYAEVFLYFNAVAAVIFLGVALFARPLVHIHISGVYLIDPKYWGGLAIVPVILGAYWFHGWYYNFSAGIFIEEKTSVFAKITLFGAFITIIANLILIPFYGMMGAAFATLLSYASMAGMLLRQVRKIYPVPYPLKKTGFLMAWAAGFFLLHIPLASWMNSELIIDVILFLAGISGVAGIVFIRKEGAQPKQSHHS